MKRPTLADLTFEYWARDLQPGVPNSLKKIIAEPGDVTVGRAKVPEYWNPKNDPATWRHLTTHFIGFGAAGDWWSRPKISTTALHPTYSGDYAGVVDGSIQWLDPFSGNARMDLWHAALNSRGAVKVVTVIAWVAILAFELPLLVLVLPEPTPQTRTTRRHGGVKAKVTRSTAGRTHETGRGAEWAWGAGFVARRTKLPR